MTQILARFRAFVKTIRDNLTDLHDPAGIHWHRAVNATVAGGIASLLLLFNPAVFQPLAIISALIFSHTNKGNRLDQQRWSMGLSFGVTLLGILLLTLVYPLNLAQSIVIILLSFLADYTTKFGSQYGFKLVLILCLVAARGDNLLEKIPLNLLNIGIGFGLAYLLCCQCYPYKTQKALRTLSHRIDQRLAELLNKITLGKNTLFLKRRLFSLLQTYAENLTSLAPLTKEEHLQHFSRQMSLFEALITLERSLISCPELPDLEWLNARMAGYGKGEVIPPLQTTETVQQTVQALVTILDEPQSSRPLVLPPKPQKPAPQFWDFHDAIAHQALRSAIAVGLALIIGQGFNLPHRDWIVISALIVSQESVGDTLRKSYARIWGSVAGLMGTLVLIVVVLQSHTFALILAFLTIFPYLYLRPSLNHYGYAKFFQQIAVICFWVLIGEPANPEVIEWRMGNVVLGCVIGQGVSLFIFPHWSRDSWKKTLIKALADCQALFQAIAQANRSLSWDTDQLATLSYQACCSVYQMDSRLESRQQELKLKGEKISHRWDLINVNRVLYEAILYWGFTVKTELSTSHFPTSLDLEKVELMANIDQALTLLQNAVGFQITFEKPLIPEGIKFLSPLQQIAEAIAAYAMVKNRYTAPR